MKYLYAENATRAFPKNTSFNIVDINAGTPIGVLAVADDGLADELLAVKGVIAISREDHDILIKKKQPKYESLNASKPQPGQAEVSLLKGQGAVVVDNPTPPKDEIVSDGGAVNIDDVLEVKTFVQPTSEQSESTQPEQDPAQ